jgi:hypothetical protein
MAYVTPITFVALSTLTAAQLNSIQTNISALWPYTAAGDIGYTTSASVLARLAKGTAGQVLKMNAGASAPEWGGVSVVGSKVIRSSAQSISDSSFTEISYATEYFDTANMFSAGSPTVLTTSVSGIYLVGGKAYFDANAAGYRIASIYQNATSIATQQYVPGAVTFSATDMVTLANVTAGQTFSLKVWQNSGGALNAYGSLWAVLLG